MLKAEWDPGKRIYLYLAEMSREQGNADIVNVVDGFSLDEVRVDLYR